MSTKEYQRAWRARHGAETGKPGRKRQSTCGSAAGYKVHLYHQTPPCDLCKAAWAVQNKIWYHARRDLRAQP